MSHLVRIKTKLALHPHKRIIGLLDGQYASALTGRSLDFNDLRTYVPGDDVKDIDWKASARHSTTLVKRYVADRKHTLTIAFAAGREMSASANFSETKIQIGLMTTGLLAFLALNHGDYVGLYACDGAGVQAFRPSTREIEVERMLNKIEDLCKPDAKPVDLSALLDFIVGGPRRRSIVLLVTEDKTFTPEQINQLNRIAVQHELILVTITDLNPAVPELVGKKVQDQKTKQLIPRFIYGDEKLCQEITAQMKDRQQVRKDLCARLGVVNTQIGQMDQVITEVFKLLERMKHAHRG